MIKELKRLKKSFFPKPIHWFFCLNDNRNSAFIEMAKVAVLSSLPFKMKRYCIYDGNDQAFIGFLELNNVQVIPWEFSLKDEIRKHVSEPSQNTNFGAYLRVDIPKIVQKLQLDIDFYLYTDCDVIFQNDPSPLLSDIKPKYIGATGEIKREQDTIFNSGVMWCNTKNLLETYDLFKTFVVKNKFNFKACDQGALNAFYSADKIPDELNWKPYWGINPKASIIHFHGPKPSHHEMFLKNGRSITGKHSLKSLEYFFQPDFLSSYFLYVSKFNYILNGINSSHEWKTGAAKTIICSKKSPFYQNAKALSGSLNFYNFEQLTEFDLESLVFCSDTLTLYDDLPSFEWIPNQTKTKLNIVSKIGTDVRHITQDLETKAIAYSILPENLAEEKSSQILAPIRPIQACETEKKSIPYIDSQRTKDEALVFKQLFTKDTLNPQIQPDSYYLFSLNGGSLIFQNDCFEFAFDSNRAPIREFSGNRFRQFKDKDLDNINILKLLEVDSDIIHLNLAGNFWHFHHETLGQLCIYEQFNILKEIAGKDACILVSFSKSFHLYQKQLIRDIFGFDIDSCKVVFAEPNTLYWTKRKIFLTNQLARAGGLPLPFTDKIINKKVNNNVPKSDLFWISNKSESKRFCTNELEVLQNLKKGGLNFELLDFSVLTELQRIEVFKRAKVCIFSAGTQGHLQAYSNLDVATFIHLSPGSDFSRTCSETAKLINAKHFHYKGTPIVESECKKDEPINPRNLNFTIDPHYFQKFIAECLKDYDLKSDFLKEDPKTIKTDFKVFMGPEEISLIERYLSKKPTARMLEFGCGGSTLHFSRLVESYTSVEFDFDWYQKISKAINYLGLKNIQLQYRSSSDSYSDFTNFPAEFTNRTYDFVLIDGRERVQCGTNCLPFLSDQSLVFVHDYYSRPHYRALEEKYDIVEGISSGQSLVVLKPKALWTNPLSTNTPKASYEKHLFSAARKNTVAQPDPYFLIAVNLGSALYQRDLYEFVFDSNMEIIPEPSGLRYKAFNKNDLKKLNFSETYKTDKSIICFGLANHYFHFHHETLAQYCIYDYFKTIKKADRKNTLILFNFSKKITQVQLDAMEFLFKDKLNDFEWIFAKDNVLYRTTKTLYTTTQISRGGSIPTPFTFLELSKRTHRVSDPSEFIWISREDATYRKCLNEDLVISHLRKQGIPIQKITLGNMSFEQQVSIFREAKCVVGISGASLTNIVYSDPNKCFIVPIGPSGGVIQSSLDMIESLGFKSFEVRGYDSIQPIPVNPTTQQPFCHNFNIDPVAIFRAIENNFRLKNSELGSSMPHGSATQDQKTPFEVL